MDYFDQFQYYYNITYIEFDVLNGVLKFSAISSDTGEKIKIEITQIEKIVWDRDESLKEQKKFVSFGFYENKCSIKVDSKKCIWNAYLFDIQESDKCFKRIEIEFGENLFCSCTAKEIFINDEEL